jgi:hypothetical protein
MFPTFGKHFEWYHFTIGVEKKKTCFELQRLCPPSTVQNEKTFYRTFHLKGEILMMKRNVWKKILPALMLAAASTFANAANVSVTAPTSLTTNATNGVAVIFDNNGSTNSELVVTIDGTTTANTVDFSIENTISLTDLSLTYSTQLTGDVTGVRINDTANSGWATNPSILQTFDIGKIELTVSDSDSNSVTGLYVENYFGANFTCDSISVTSDGTVIGINSFTGIDPAYGSFKTGASIVVESTTEGDATGVKVEGDNGIAVLSIDVSAKAKKGDVAGIDASGNNDEAKYHGKVTATTEEGNAAGILLSGDTVDVEISGEVSAKVTGLGNAVGITGTGSDANLDISSIVTAETIDGDAAGINLAGDRATITFSGSASANATGNGNAVGMNAEGEGSTIEGTGNVSAKTAGTGDAVAFHLNGTGAGSSANFTGDATAEATGAGNAIAISGEGTITLAAISGNISATADSGNATGIDVSAATLSSALTITGNVSAVNTGGTALAVKAGSNDVVIEGTNDGTNDNEVTGLVQTTGNLELKQFTNNGGEFNAEAGSVKFTGTTTLANGEIKSNTFTVGDGVTSLGSGLKLTGDGSSAMTFTTNNAGNLSTLGLIDAGGQNVSVLGNGTASLMGKFNAGRLVVGGTATLESDLANVIKFDAYDVASFDGITGIDISNGAKLKAVGGAGVSSWSEEQLKNTEEFLNDAYTNNDITAAGDIENDLIFGGYLNGSYVDGSGIHLAYDAFAGFAVQDTPLVAHLFHNKFTAWSAVRDRLISAQRRGGAGYLGQEPCDPCNPCNPCDPCGSPLGTAARTAWVNYVGRGTTYQDGQVNSNWRIGTDGVQVGADLYRSRKTQIGLLFGYEGGKATLLDDEVKSNDAYVGFYGVRVFNNGADARFVFNKGWQNFDLSRASVKAASFDGETTEITAELGKRFYRGAWSVRPVVAFDYYSSELAAFDIAAFALSFQKSYFSQTFFRVGSDLKFEQGRFALNSGLYYSYDVYGDTLKTEVVGAGTLQGSKLGRDVLTFNVGGSYLIGKNLTVFGGYQGEAMLNASKNSVQHTGHVGGSVRW